MARNRSIGGEPEREHADYIGSVVRSADVIRALRVAMSGQLDQTRNEDDQLYTRAEIATQVLGGGWSESKLGEVFTRANREPKPEELEDIQNRLHVWVTTNYVPSDDRSARIPEDPRTFTLTTLNARLNENPRSAPCVVPTSWFVPLAQSLHASVSPSPIQVIAAGQALVRSIEMLDNPIATREARDALYRRLDQDGLVAHVVDWLLKAGQLPPGVFGSDAMSLLGRLRLPGVLKAAAAGVEAEGAGFRLLRVFTFTVQAERQLLRQLLTETTSKAVRTHLAEVVASCFTVATLDLHLRPVLDKLAQQDTAVVDAYPARSLAVDAVQQRLKLHEELHAALQGDNLAKACGGADALRSAIECYGRFLWKKVDDIGAPQRKRAYALQVLANEQMAAYRSLDIEVPKFEVKKVRYGFEKAELFIHALEHAVPGDTYEEISELREEIRDLDGYDVARQRTAGDVDRVKQIVRRWVTSREKSIPPSIRVDVEVLLVRMLTSYDGVARRRAADTLRGALLTRPCAEILTMFLQDELEDEHALQWKVPTWIRDLAVLGISFLSIVDARETISRLVNIVEEKGPVIDEGPSSVVGRSWLAHAALWTIGDLALTKLASLSATQFSSPAAATAYWVARDAAYRAAWFPSPRVQRAAAYALRAFELIEIDQTLVPEDVQRDRPTTREQVEELLADIGRGVATEPPDFVVEWFEENQPDAEITVERPVVPVAFRSRGDDKTLQILLSEVGKSMAMIARTPVEDRG